MNNETTKAEETTVEETTTTSPTTETPTTTETPSTTTTTETPTLTETTTENQLTETTTTETPTVVQNDYENETISLDNGFVIDGTKNAKTEGETFSAINSEFTIENGNTFTIANTSIDISLKNSQFTNNDSTSVFLNAANSQINLTINNQVTEGDIVLDNLSTLSLVLGNSSYYMGIVNADNTAKSVSVTLDKTSQFILAGDSYIDTLENPDEENMNIYSNGYKLYVAGKEVEINGSEIPEAPNTKTKEETETETETVEPATTGKVTKSETDLTPLIVASIAILVIAGAIFAIIIHNKKKNAPTGSVAAFPETPSGRPDFSAFDDGPVAQPQLPEQPVKTSEPTFNGIPGAQETPATPANPATPVTPVGPENASPINPFHPNS